jgi:hypothetical protein
MRNRNVSIPFMEQAGDKLLIRREGRPEIIGFMKGDGLAGCTTTAVPPDQRNIASFTPIENFFYSRFLDHVN